VSPLFEVSSFHRSGLTERPAHDAAQTGVENDSQKYRAGASGELGHVCDLDMVRGAYGEVAREQIRGVRPSIPAVIGSSEAVLFTTDQVTFLHRGRYCLT
jgi:hypothetical protein